VDGSGSLREGDVEAMLRLVDDARQDDPGPAFPWVLFHGLRRLIPCDVDVGYICNNYSERWSPMHQLLDEDHAHHVEVVDERPPDPDAEPFWDLFWDSHCGYPQRSGDLRSVTMTSDFYPTARDRAADPMHEVLPDFTHAMTVSFPEVVPGAYRRIVLRRAEDRSFTERDRQILQLLRPHLHEAWLDAERRRACVPALTAREWEVLGLAGAGLSYPQIAAVLCISVGTVRKHMEHVRERLGVHSVRAAAALALPHAPSPAGRARVTVWQGGRTTT